VGTLHIDGLTPQEAEEFYTSCYLIRAAAANILDYGLTSIVILTRNQLPYTRECLDSIRLRTDEPYELIVVDNGSTDGTVEYLRSQPDVKLIENRDNRGFPAGCNQGIRVADGDQVLLLNNDVIVTTGWLGRLLTALHSDPEIGLVGPCTNWAWGKQRVPASYADLAGLDGWAWEWGKLHDRILEDPPERLVGFCLLFRRSLVDEIGLLDERFGLGNFEDDDYCRRARRAGYRATIAKGVFVHHYGGVTHGGEGVGPALLRRNRQLYEEKWRELEGETGQSDTNAPSSAVEQRPRPEVAREGGSELTPEGSPIRLSLCMIVRDNERTIRPCLESIRPWVDEMVVVDTGSNDPTPSIAEGYGARVLHFPWCDDFSAARNESLRHAHGKWLFWMDSDDTISAECGRKLQKLATQSHDESTLGFVMQVHCPGQDADADVTVVDHVKMFRNHPELRFEGRVHEQVLPAIRRLGGEVAWTDINLVHSGSDRSPERRRQKQQRDLRLLELELRDRPDHPFALFNLGMTFSDMDEHDKAAEALERCLEASQPGESHVRKAYALAVASYAQLDRYDRAEAICRKGRELFPKDRELLFRQGIIAHRAGRLDEAAASYRGAIRGGEGRHFTSIDRGIGGFKARHNLALVYEDMGQLDLAELQWREVAREVPGYRPGRRSLTDVLLRQNRLVSAEIECESMLHDERLRPEGLRVKAEVNQARGELAETRHLLEVAVEEYPDDIAARESLCRFLFEWGDPAEAESALGELTRRAPGDAAAHHNLGQIQLNRGKHEEAVASFRTSLGLRPHAAQTLLQLGYALRAMGRHEEAEDAWKQARGLAPDDPLVRSVVEEQSESY